MLMIGRFTKEWFGWLINKWLTYLTFWALFRRRRRWRMKKNKKYKFPKFSIWKFKNLLQTEKVYIVLKNSCQKSVGAINPKLSFDLQLKFKCNGGNRDLWNWRKSVEYKIISVIFSVFTHIREHLKKHWSFFGEISV